MTIALVLAGESGATVSFLDSPHGGKGNTPAMAQGASVRKIRPNEPIGIDYGVGVNGYIVDQFRTLVIGHLPDDLIRAHDLSLEIHTLFVKEVKSGIAWSDLYRLIIEKVQKTAYGKYFNG